MHQELTQRVVAYSLLIAPADGHTHGSHTRTPSTAPYLLDKCKIDIFATTPWTQFGEDTEIKMNRRRVGLPISPEEQPPGRGRGSAERTHTISYKFPKAGQKLALSRHHRAFDPIYASSDHPNLTQRSLATSLHERNQAFPPTVRPTRHFFSVLLLWSGATKH